MKSVTVATTVFGTDWILPPEHADMIRQVDADIKLHVPGNNGELAEILPEVEVVFGRWLSADELARAEKLRWVQLASAGADSALAAGAANSEVIVTTAAGVHPVQISEHVLAMMLMFCRRMVECIDNQKVGNWDRGPISRIDELYEKTLGIVGLGAIGAAIARKAKAFDMKVLATRRHVEEGDETAEVDELLPHDKLDYLLTESDYVVLAVPLTAETTGLLGARELGLMKPTSILINIARGAVIDEEALVTALRKGQIGGAGLDTFAKEPLPPASPLWNMQNVIITPHTAGASPRYWQRATALFCENLRRYLNDEPLQNTVVRSRGY